MRTPVLFLILCLLGGGGAACTASASRPGALAPTGAVEQPHVLPTRRATEPPAAAPMGARSVAPPALPRVEMTPVRMTVARAAHTATLLPDGTLLLVGGFAAGEEALASAERFDPRERSFTPVEAMSVARQSHTATLLPDGRVLIAGGFNGEYLDSAELFDPATGRFTPSGRMREARSGHGALLLPDGRVLVVGGTGKGWSFLDSAELYDPTTGTFTPTGSMIAPRESHTVTLLPDGRALITGGHRGRRAAITIYQSAELYDPGAGTFAPTGAMTVRRHKHDATLLPDGRVLIAGGADERDAAGAYRTTEIYDPHTGDFSPSGAMTVARYKYGGTTLPLESGELLFLGGGSAVEMYDPLSGTFAIMEGVTVESRFFATATLLPGGEALLAGGYGPRTRADDAGWLFVIK